MDSNVIKIKVLFVCMGNICRSPTGEGVFKNYVNVKGKATVFYIDSAGTLDYHAGHPADSRMSQAASKRGYVLDSFARQINASDLEVFDLVVAMDSENLSELEYLSGGPRSHIRMLGSFLPGVEGNLDARSVPDPYYGGDAGFEEVLDMIEEACPAMLEYCLSLQAK